MGETLCRKLDGVSQCLDRHRPLQLSGAALKWIALVTMLIDHIAAMCVATIEVWEWATLWNVWGIYSIMRGIGRTAMPIFMFLLVEGFFYTHNRWKHLGRLAVFALVAEIPFDLTIFGWFTWEHCSVITTMLICFAMLMAVDAILKLPAGEEKQGRFYGIWAGKIAGAAAVSALTLVLLTVIGADYTWCAGAMTLAFYLLRRWRWLAALAAYALLVLLDMSELYAIVGILLILCYNGQKGRQPKWLFYVFYPMHLFLLYLLRLWVFGA
ncbi:MAG: TraX family protein [Eubacteriales bacterium]|nr:TraX family protein [Eubacteriales bacterium]